MSLPLTIAIPTFNRAAALDRLLDNLCGQPGIGNVQVVVSDNGSTDATAAVIQAFSSRLAIKRSGFESNRGFDANYLNCVTAADGDHLWIVGDDDALVPDAVATVLAAIRADAPDLLVCNGGDLRAGQLVPRVRYPVRAFSTLEDLMPQIGWHLCWIGTCVVRRSRYRPELLRPRDFNAFVHLPLLAGALGGTFRGHFVDRVLLHTTVNHSSYFKDPRVLIETFGRQLHDTLEVLGHGRAARRTAALMVRAFHERLAMFGLRDFLTFRLDARFGFLEFVRRLVFVRRLNRWAPLYGFLYLIPANWLKDALAVWRNRRSGQRTAA